MRDFDSPSLCLFRNPVVPVLKFNPSRHYKHLSIISPESMIYLVLDSNSKRAESSSAFSRYILDLVTPLNILNYISIKFDYSISIYC